MSAEKTTKIQEETKMASQLQESDRQSPNGNQQNCPNDKRQPISKNEEKFEHHEKQIQDRL